MSSLIQLYLYCLYVLDVLWIIWLVQFLKFWTCMSWYTIPTVNGTTTPYGAYVIINYFYLVNSNHTIAQFKQYDLNGFINKFTIDNTCIDIREGTVDGQDVFLDDISLA